MKFNILVIQPQSSGGGQIAVERLVKDCKARDGSFQCDYKVFDPFLEINKKFSFIGRVVGYLKLNREEIKEILKKQKYDFFLTSDHLLALAFLSLNIKNTKIIFLFHGLRSIIIKNIFDINYRQIIIKLMERISWILSSAVIVPSGEAKSYILKKTWPFLSSQKIFLVPNIVPKLFFTNGKKVTSNKTYNILYSGRLAKYKGLENLITAFSMLVSEVPNSNLYLAYPTSVPGQNIEKTIKNLVKKYRLEKSVNFTKDLPDKQLIKLYKKSDVSILPSELEFAPLSVLESMASGTPIIGTDVGNIGSLLKKIDFRLILKNNSPEEICSKLVVFHDLKNSQKDIISKKSIKIASDFSENKATRSFKKVLNSFQNNTSR
jgi:glycosyltransferase involved in cell wall biosynthesis